MSVTRSYSPNGLIRPNPDFYLCCGHFHATTAAKFFAVVFFGICLVVSALNVLFFGIDKQWISIFCFFYTVYSTILIYGVFLEKPMFLVPFLFIHGALSAFLIVVIIFFCTFGFATDVVRTHHAENQPLRELYGMHHLNPDDEDTQTIVTSIALFTVTFSYIMCTYSWYAIYQAFKSFKEENRTMLPGCELGIVATNDDENENEKN
ncbi:unnamed protein product [Caenorhabditis bovis]|uniref:Uncharacterized protein n=1 Tax=Caenorhabditis bovis TaxID=2654633 RepID=A0A8S1FGG5_9PELO|nr:unnamed protein product [Caenorhabditis bovis]